MEFEPIGVAHTPFHEKVDAPRQSRVAEGVSATLELFRGRDFRDALRDIEEWSHLWVLYVFDRADGWSPTVQPPRSTRKRGVFSTRAPRRPNPIGMSVVRLQKVDGLILHVTDIDLLDGTPLLDIKPYLPWADALDANHGWLERPDDPGPQFDVVLSDVATAQLEWLEARGEEVHERLTNQLALGPAPHAYRRIRKDGDGFVIRVKKWRARFVVEGKRVHVQRLFSGHRPKALALDETLTLAREFISRWP